MFHLTKDVEGNYQYKPVELKIVTKEIIQFHNDHYFCYTSLVTLGDITGYRLLTNNQDPIITIIYKNKDTFLCTIQEYNKGVSGGKFYIIPVQVPSIV